MVSEAFSILTNGLTDSAPGVRDAASEGVGLCLYMESNSFAKPALPLLMKNLNDKFDYVRSDTINALTLYAQRQSRHSPPQDAKADLLVPLLIESLHDKSSFARYSAAITLTYRCFRDRVNHSIPDIEKLLSDPNDDVKHTAALLLKKLNRVPSTNATQNPAGTSTFSVTAAGTVPLSYQWHFNPSNSAGATNPAPK